MDRAWIPYCGAAPVPADWLMRWNFDPVVLLALAALSIWAWRRGSAAPPFWVGLAVLCLIFISPLCALSSALFSARVAHHAALTTVAAPLLIQGLTNLTVRGSAGAWAAVHAALFWLWHAPPPYAAALSYDLIYWLMQGSLLASALLFWKSLERAPAPLAILLLLGMMVQMGLLGALITFAPAPFYAPHLLTTQGWGLNPLEDQQLAGVIMWGPASMVYLGAALRRGWRLLAEPDPIAA